MSKLVLPSNMPILGAPQISDETFIGKALRLPFKVIPKRALVPILQGPLRGKRWTLGSSRYSCILGTYELDKQRVFIESVKPGDVVFDLGANVGYYSLLSSVLVGSSGRIESFEPFVSNVETIKKHLAVNSVTNCAVHECAVSDFDGFATFEENTESNAMGHLSEEKGNQVRVVTLDRMFSQGLLRAPKVIKCDIEGSEYKMLCGAAYLFETTRPVLFLATHGTAVTLQCIQWLTARGYRLQALDHVRTLEDSSEILARPS